jgi:hypothetical protein
MKLLWLSLLSSFTQCFVYRKVPLLWRYSTLHVLNAQPTIDIEKINSYQWQQLNTHHLGEWKGVQTGYDPNNDEVADHMYVECSLSRSDGSDSGSSNNEIVHTSSIVAGEIRTDCEVCFDSERVKTKTIGIYQPGKLRSRFCSNAEVKG